MGKIIKFYTKSDGKSPVREFLDSLPSKVAQKLLGFWQLLSHTM